MSENKIPFIEFVALMALYVSLMAMSIDTILPALFLIQQDLQISNPNQTQFIIGSLFLGFTFGQIFFGPLSDSFGRKRTIYLGILIFIIGNLFSIFAQSFEVMLFGRILQGFGAASPRVISIAIVRDQFKGRDMARVMSFIMSVFIFVPIIAPTIGQIFLMFFSWHSIFILFIVASIIAMIWTFFRLNETLKPSEVKPFNFKTIKNDFILVIKNKLTFGYAVCSGISFGSLIAYINSSRQIFQEYFEVANLFPLYFAISAISIGIATFTNSQIVKKYGMRLLCKRGLITIIITSAIFLITIYSNDEKIQLSHFMIFASIVFFCMGLLFGNLNALAMEPMGHMAGTASAIIGTISSTISLMIGTTIGQSYNGTPIPLILGFLIFSILSFALLTYLSKLKQ